MASKSAKDCLVAIIKAWAHELGAAAVPMSLWAFLYLVLFISTYYMLTNPLPYYVMSALLRLPTPLWLLGGNKWTALALTPFSPMEVFAGGSIALNMCLDFVIPIILMIMASVTSATIREVEASASPAIRKVGPYLTLHGWEAVLYLIIATYMASLTSLLLPAFGGRPGSGASIIAASLSALLLTIYELSIIAMAMGIIKRTIRACESNSLILVSSIGMAVSIAVILSSFNSAVSLVSRELHVVGLAYFVLILAVRAIIVGKGGA